MYKLLTASVALLISFHCLPILPHHVAHEKAAPSQNSPSMLPVTDGDAYRSSHHAFAAPVILLDVGHGGIDGGTSAQGVLEKISTSPLAKGLSPASQQRLCRYHQSAW